MAEYYVYIMTNRSRTLYTGVTNDLVRRVHEHKNKIVGGFTKKYNITRLVYFEQTADVYAARALEKQIKGFDDLVLRATKISKANNAPPSTTMGLFQKNK